MIRCVVILTLLSMVGVVHAGPPLQERLDETRYIEGLIDAELPEVLTHYLTTHPPRTERSRRWHHLAVASLERDGATSASARRAATRAVIEARAAILAAEPDDPRRVRWTIDQAEEIYVGLLADESVVALAGVPTPGQRRRVLETAGLLGTAVIAASKVVSTRLGELGTTAQDDAERRRLIEVDEERRLRFLQLVARVLEKTLSTSPSQPAALSNEASGLEQVAARLNGWQAARGWLYAGTVWARVGDRASAAAAFESAASVSGAEPAVRLAARLGHATLDQPAGVTLESFADETHGHAYERLLVADHVARVASPEAAVEVYLTLDQATLGLDAVALDAIVWSKLAGLGALWTEESWPAAVEAAVARSRMTTEPGAALATLERLSADGGLPPSLAPAVWRLKGEALAADGRVAEAIDTWLELARRWPRSGDTRWGLRAAAAAGQAARDPALASRLRATLAELLILDSEADDIDRYRVAAASLAYSAGEDDAVLAMLAEVDPGGEQGVDAATLRVVTLRRLALQAPGSTHFAAWGRVRETARSGRETLQTQHDAQTLAALRLYEAEAALELDDPADTLTLLDGIDPAANPALEAHTLRLQVEALRRRGRLEDARATLDALFDRSPVVAAPVLQSMLTASLERARAGALDEEALPESTVTLAERLAAWAIEDDGGGPYRAALLRTVADAFRLAGRHRPALTLYDELLVDDPAAGPLLFGRAECLLDLGSEHAAEAIGLYRRLAAAGPGLDPDIYWTSQLRIVQILDRVDRNTHQIVPRIRRLRQEDPTLGGPRYHRGFRILEEKY